MNAQSIKRSSFLFRILPALLIFSATLGGVWLVTGCHSSAQAAQQAQQTDPNYDPADANMAPVTGSDTSQAAIEPYPSQTQQQQAAPIVRQAPSSGAQNESVQRAQEYSQTGQQAGAPDQNQGQNQDQSQDQNQAPDQAQQANPDGDPNVSPDEEAAYEELEANQPPPALPTYDQPPAPEPNYLWTPGYWGYAPAGYYWVPGVWVAAPWPGALWTPGYWGYYGGYYRFHRGYWGRYIGFYGGVPYGYGYTGFGFYGGYWRGNSFYYNRSVTRINNVHITNVYSRNVVVRNVTRVSYNGGPRGIQVHPRPAEIAARREPRLPPMNTQVQVRDQAQQNRQQFYNSNRGRPPVVAAQRPITADAGVQRPTTRPTPPHQGAQFRPGQPGQPQIQPAHPQPNVRPDQPQARPTPPQQVRPEVRPDQPNVRPVQPNQQYKPQYQPRYQSPMPQTQQQQQYHPQPQPQTRPAPQQQYHSQPQPQTHPAPQQQYHPQQQRPPSQPSPQHNMMQQPHGGGGQQGGGSQHQGGGEHQHGR